MKAKTIAGLLRERAESGRGGEVAIRFREGDGWVEWSWEQYWRTARALQAGLVAAGVRPGDHVLVALPQVRPAAAALFGMWALGVVPIQVALPSSLREPRAFFEQLSATAARLNASWLLTKEELAEAAEAARLSVLAPDRLHGDPDVAGLPDPDAACGTAFLQLTSGSTSVPRAVVVPHDRLMLHMECISRALPSHSDSVAVSWLPLHHDMGLIGGLLFPFFNGFPVHLIATEDFRLRPSLWLEAMSQFCGTITAAPSSAYALSLSLAPRLLNAGIDLSAWECAMIGAEPISAALLHRFGRAFAGAGFRENAFFPVYGLAEATVAVTFSKLLEPAKVDRVDRNALERDGAAVTSNGEDTIQLVGVGRAIPGTDIRIVDDSGNGLPDRIAGEIEVRSSSSALGYYGDATATALTWRGEWLCTGDIGYIAEGTLFVTGRKKEMIIKGGHNLIPSVVEEIVCEVDGVRAGGVAAVGVRSEWQETELVCVVAETACDPPQYAALSERIRAALKARGVAPDRIVLVAPRALPRTTSGKLQRTLISQMVARESSAVALTPTV